MKFNPVTIVITLVSGVSIFGAIAYNGAQINQPLANESKPSASSPRASLQVGEMSSALLDLDTLSVNSLPLVSVIEPKAQTYQTEVVGYGEAKPRFELSFTGEVNGRIDTISSRFESGQVVKKGELLASVDPTQYQQAVTLAKANVAQAQLNYLEEQRQGEQAKSEWKRSGLSGEPDSPLVLREPQMAQVQAALDNAKLELLKAQKDLENTHIKAPFDALVVSRNLHPGSYLPTGGEIATLYSISEVEIEIPLSESQWNALPKMENKQLNQQHGDWLVTLTNSDGDETWQGYVGRIQQHLSQSTRQRSLVVIVDKPLEQTSDLYPGTFVKATISGKSIDSVWQLPASAVSQQGDLWLVSENGLLTKMPADKQFEKSGKVYINASNVKDAQLDDTNLQSDYSFKVVTRPLNSYQVGMKVTAKVEG